MNYLWFCTNSQILLSILFQLREYAKTLQEMVIAGKEEEIILSKTEEFMETIYRIVGICLGIPLRSFTWEYYDKSKQYCIQENMSPLDFYDKLVKPLYNVEDKVITLDDKNSLYPMIHHIWCLMNL